MKRIRRAPLLAVLALIAALLMILVCFLGWNARTCARVSPNYEYFLLVRPCEESTSAAVVEESYSAGGAAVMYGRDKVVLACYFSRSDAERVCAQTRAEGTEAEVVRIASSEFFLYGRNAAYADRAAANAATADSVARMLYDTANGLERSELGQSEAIAALKGAAASLKGLRTGNGDALGDWNNALYRAEKAARETADGIVFAKDVRRVQTMLCMSVAGMGEIL